MSEFYEFDLLDPDMLNDEYWETLYWEEELDFVVFINEKENNFDFHQFFKYVIDNIVLGAKYEIMVENYDHSTVTEIIEYLKKLEPHL